MSRPVRLAAATVLAAAAGLAGPAPAAYAEACSTGDGVTVVVDPHGLGGGLQQVCDGGGGGEKAAALFSDNGFPLDYVQRQPGFVCRVSGAPADDPCVNTPPADAYWGLWWSDGESGSWTYSTVGVGSLTIPEGGSVALSWNGSTTKAPPGAPPPQHPAEPTEPTEEPEPTRPPSSSGPTQQPSQPPTTSGGEPSASPSDEPSASPSAQPRDRRDRTLREVSRDRDRAGRDGRDGRDRDRDEEESASAEPSPSEGTTPAAAQSDPAPAPDGLPAWIGPLAIGALLAVAGVATYLRRRTS